MVVTEEGFTTLPPGPIRSSGGLPVLGSGLETIGPALSALAGKIGDLRDPNRGLRQAIITRAFLDPEFAQALGRAQRTAEQAAVEGLTIEGAAPGGAGVGPVPVVGAPEANVLSGLGIPTEVTRAIASLAPTTVEEETERAGLRAGIPGRAVEAEAETLDQRLRALRSFGLLGGPELGSRAEVAESRAKAATAEVQEATATEALANELPALRAGLERLQLDIGEQATEWVSDFFQTVEDDEDKLKLALALFGPGGQAFLRELQLRDERAFREHLARIQQEGAGALNATERLKLILQLGDDFQSAASTLDETEDDAAKELLYVRLANLANIQKQVAPEMLSFVPELETTGWFGGGREVNIAAEKLSPLVQRIYQQHLPRAAARGVEYIFGLDPEFQRTLTEADLLDQFEEDVEAFRKAVEGIEVEEESPTGTRSFGFGPDLSVSGDFFGRLLRGTGATGPAAPGITPEEQAMMDFFIKLLGSTGATGPAGVQP